jgi:hypothetical protein
VLRNFIVPNRPMSIKPAFAILVLSFSLGLMGCHSDHVAVDRKDPKTPQFAYRLDELAMLQMAVDDIQDAERDKRYGKIYDDFASPEFMAETSRRRFLIWGNCAETYLGGLEEYDRNELGFFREKAKSKMPIDSIVRTVHRSRFVVKERMGFIYDGIHFKLRTWTWITNDKPFLECMADSPRLEGGTKPIEASSEDESKRKALESEGNSASTTSESQHSNRVEPESPSRIEPSTATDKPVESERRSASKSETPAPSTESKEKEADSTSKDAPASNSASPTPEVAPTSLHYARSQWHKPSASPTSKSTTPATHSSTTPAPEKAPHNSPPVPGQG